MTRGTRRSLVLLVALALLVAACSSGDAEK